MKIPEGFLPEDPEEGVAYIAPKGTVLGESHILTLVQNGIIKGHSQTLTRVPNSIRRCQLGRTVTYEELQRGMWANIVYTKYNITSVVFVENYGWQASGYTKGTVISDKKMSIVDFVHVPLAGSVLFVYEIVDLEELKEIP
jgi:hypothetical protein